MEQINILAIDGGGMYGVVAAEALKHIEAQVGKLSDKIHLMAGTSTGSILTAGLLHGYTSTELQDLYFEEGPNIFKKPRKKVLFGLARTAPKYKGKYLRRAMEQYFGHVLMEDLPGRLMISAYDMSHYRTHYFKSWDVQGLLLRDAVVASSSAPTFHPMHRVGTVCYTDGGVFAANPALGALGEAYKHPEFTNDTKINIISIGTGMKPNGIDCTDQVRNKGDIWWVEQMPGVFLDGMDEVPVNVLDCLSSDPSSRVTHHRLDVVVSSKRSDELRLEKLQDGINRMKNWLANDGNDKLKSVVEILNG